MTFVLIVIQTQAQVFFYVHGTVHRYVFKKNQQDAALHNSISTINALHVSGGSSARHQKLKTVYTAPGICRE
jgi:hypothetical protein